MYASHQWIFFVCESLARISRLLKNGLLFSFTRRLVKTSLFSLFSPDEINDLETSFKKEVSLEERMLYSQGIDMHIGADEAGDSAPAPLTW